MQKLNLVQFLTTFRLFHCAKRIQNEQSFQIQLICFVTTEPDSNCFSTYQVVRPQPYLITPNISLHVVFEDYHKYLATCGVRLSQILRFLFRAAK